MDRAEWRDEDAEKDHSPQEETLRTRAKKNMPMMAVIASRPSASSAWSSDAGAAGRLAREVGEADAVAAGLANLGEAHMETDGLGASGQDARRLDDAGEKENPRSRPPGGARLRRGPSRPRRSR